MKFTYDSYKLMLDNLKFNDYEFATYYDWKEKHRPVILRHDIDNDISKAVNIGNIEYSCGIKSTYFVLLSSDFYNVFSRESYNELKSIIEMGHTIGLHFDETRYTHIKGDYEAIKESILQEASILSKALGIKIDTVSMHRPCKNLLEADLEIPGMINSYSNLFFKDFKYLSDSRCTWREPVDEIIASGKYDRLHILTHAFWYGEKEADIHDTVRKFINNGNASRYKWFQSNIKDLESIMNIDEVK